MLKIIATIILYFIAIIIFASAVNCVYHGGEDDGICSYKYRGEDDTNE